jgi:hypothetical protein
VTRSAYAIVVGNVLDPHVEAVIGRIPSDGLVVVDAERTSESIAHLDESGMCLTDLTGARCSVDASTPVRGWMRRLAPAGWDHGVVLGRHDSAVLAARLTLLASVLREPAVAWLTMVDDLFAAENKIVQYRRAIAEGIRVPDFVVAGDSAELGERLGDPFALKPLGPGNFVNDDGQQQVVFVQAVQASDLDTVDLLHAPFLAQRIVRAKRHLRVVTVGEMSWVAELDATDLPMDWRAIGSAHRSFQATSQWPEVEYDAARLASALRVGFTSQDWIVDVDGPAFLDLNPAGQWLFLPEQVARPVTAELSRWLKETR